MDLLGRKAKGLKVPKEPTDQEREAHNMTHVPYATWCPICVKAKGKEDHHKTCVLKDPAIQVDFNFGGTSGSVLRVLLTACDVQTGLISATVVP